MSCRTTITFICDECGRTQDHEMTSSGFHEQIWTSEPNPRDWKSLKLEGGGDLSPRLHFCPTCKDKPKRGRESRNAIEDQKTQA